MRTLIVKIFFVLFLFTNLSPGQDWVKDYDGIPVHTWLWWGFTDSLIYPDAINNMKSIVDIVTTDIGILEGEVINPEDQVSFLKSKGLKLIPVRTRTTEASPLYNWIQHYTDAKYSVWEAEGTPPSVSEAMLEYDSDVMDKITENDVAYIKLKSNRSGIVDTLIWGPYYNQDVYYYASQNDSITEVRYTADFRLKLDYNNNYPTQMDNPNDEVCIIQVTYSDHAGLYQLGQTHTVASDTLQRWEFQNYFKQFLLEDYRLDVNTEGSSIPIQPPPQCTFNSYLGIDTLMPGPRNEKNYVQFKVIWLGKPQYLISIDKVTVSDIRGRELIDPTSDAETNILLQANSLNNYNVDDLIVGWLGIDEPSSIDIFEPIRLVTKLLDENTTPQRKQPLWLAWMGGWSGTWENPLNQFGTMHLSKWKEFKKRVGRTNIWQDFYMYDYPYCDTCSYSPPDWRSENIRIVSELNYKQAYDLDPSFGVSLQCGEIHNTQAEERNITDYELLYNTNLALMNGAKFFSLYTYFAQRSTDSCESGWTCHSIVDIDPVDGHLIYTPKYYMLKNILKPRLSGLMGKTLKKLTPTEQILNPEPLTWHNFINILYHSEDAPFKTEMDLGFFKDSLNQDYVMLINRWYASGARTVPISFNSGCFGNYNNIQLYDLINNSKQTINNNGIIYPNIALGDAIFYRVAPIVRVGGSLVASETTNPNETLLDEMTIESGVTLTVNGNYYAKANITVKSGGKIVAGTNGKIIFDSGKNIIIDGSAEIKGTSSNRLSISAAASYYGIVINPGSAFIMDYCDIESIGFAISTASGTQSYVNIANSNIVTMYSGISLASSSSYEVFQTPPVPIIRNCRITASFSGISVSNYRSVLLKSNTFSNCGISVSNVVSAYIQDNDISLGSHQNHPGILFNNSGGYIRNNIIKNRSNGIHIANSSPEIGGNLIENNYLHGLYIAGSSIPNLIGQLRTNPPAYYPLAGYNRIRNNGNNTQPNSENDGSEIYFSFSDARLGTLDRPGCNEISDDRASSPNMQTIWLLSGIYGNEPHFLDAIYNYWGTTTPTSNRFGIAANFTPFNSSFLCLINGGSTTESLVLKTSSGEIVDSIFAAECVPKNISELEEIYSEANLLFARGNLIEAKQIFEQIVLGNYTTEEKLLGYNKLYTIGNLINEDENYFASLQSTFENNVNNTTDTLIKKIYNQNAINCDVSKGEYITAINKFDDIIQQNPNSEEAVYAEIDILTTALNLDTTNTLLGKINGGKYLVKGTSDYLSRLNEILQSRFGLNSDESNKIIPKEYYLHQNFPNPFNPVTVISWQSPVSSHQTIKVYDILGKEIATLVDDFREAGVYEINFNASSLSSGVYIYKLQAGEFVSSKKMILLK